MFHVCFSTKSDPRFHQHELNRRFIEYHFHRYQKVVLFQSLLLGMFPCIQDQQITLPEAAESDEGEKTWIIRVTV